MSDLTPEATPYDADAVLAQPARPSRVPLFVLGALAVLLAVACVVLALVWRAQRADRQALVDARNDAVTAAGQLVINLDALSAPTVDADLARVAAGTTGHFHQQFTAAQAQLKTYVVSGQITSSGTLLSTGVVRSDTDTATVLVAIDRTFKDRTHPTGVVAKDRWKVTLEKHHGRWLVAELEPVA